jgi:PAS domain S-box-containing protein
MPEQPVVVPHSNSLVESMTESVLVTTATLAAPGPHIVYVNPAFERMTGWSREDVIGRSPRILQGPKTDSSIFKNMHHALTTEGVWEGQATNYRKDGTEFVMEWSIVPLRDPRGNLTHYLAVQRDVTARVEMEQQLAAAREAEQGFSARLERASRKLAAVNEEQRRTLDLFKKYVPEAVVRKTLEDRGSNDLYAGELLQVTLLFCDLSHFTAHARALRPDQVVRLLNTYYGMMSSVVLHYEGVIQQFVGDEIFVTFGAPLPVRDSEEKAVRCALGMVRQLTLINETLNRELGRSLEIRIGINSGQVVAGNLGSQERLAYSITGDAVNTAKRIESLGRGIPNPVLISESVHSRVASFIESRPWPAALVRGQATEIRLFQVLGASSD